MELIQNVWTRFGFRGNPFDTAALSASASALLPIAQAIVGREMESPESKMLLGVLRSTGGGRAVVEGDIVRELPSVSLGGGGEGQAAED